MAEQFGGERTEQKFKSPEEELQFLRAKVIEHEKALAEKGNETNREEIIKEKIAEHSSKEASVVLDKDYALKKHETEAIVLELKPEEHDVKMTELLSILQEKGILNSLNVVEKLNDPHIADDFHRFLVQYIKAGFKLASENEKSPIFKALKMTLYEVSLPGTSKKDESQQKRQLKELISKMEQFYSGMFSVGDDKGYDAGYFAVELAVAGHSDEIVFYMAVPDSKKSLFEKQAQSVFSDVRLVEKKDDYNIFNETGDYVASYAEFSGNHIFPIKTYDQYDYDPLNVLMNSFSKVDRENEGASIQIIIKPAKTEKMSFYKNVLKEMEKGLKFKDALEEADSSFFNLFKQVGRQIIYSDDKKDEKKNAGATNQTPIENIKLKTSSPLAEVNIRIVASAPTTEEAGAILTEIESSFNQFENTNGNRFKFKRIFGKELLKLSRDFSFRLFDVKNSLIMNLKELTTVVHLPENDIGVSSQLKKTEAVAAPAPLDLPTEGMLLGTNIYRNIETPIRVNVEDRLRHFYLIGQTGTGKTTMLKTMIRQDIINGEGVCMIDPHGSDIQEVLSYIPPERYEDVIYFDPSYTERPMGLNMLEYDPRYPEQKTFVINEMMSIFNKLFDMKTAGGPMFEQYFRNAVNLVLEDPASGCTLLDVSRVLSDKNYRELKLSKCKNPLVIQFWKEIAGKAGGEASLANVVPYITSKFE